MFGLRLALALAATSSLSAAATAAPSAAGAAPAAEAAFRQGLGRFIDRLRAGPHAPPGTVVVVVHGGRTVFERAYGFRNLATRAPLTLDTPLYNASVTKAYTGLLAALLDAEGVLPLDASLADVWPGLRLPAPIDARAVTARRLLSHSAGINDSGLVYRSVIGGDVSAADVPRHLARHATAGPEGFVYGNFGPFVWSAMAEARTRLSWRELLARRVLAPMGLRHSSASFEAFAPGRIANCHPRGRGAWTPAPPKPTAAMNAAGGMYTSGRDAARFLQAFLTDGRVGGGGIAAPVLRRSWQMEAAQDRAIMGMHRDGYGLGWDLGAIGGHRFASRSGGYAGCRAISLFLPELDLGIVAMSNGDAGGNALHAAIIAQTIALWTGGAAGGEDSQARVDDYLRAAAREAAAVDVVDPRLARVRPIDRTAMAGLSGDYVNPRLGDFRVSRAGRGLLMTGGAFRSDLRAIGDDMFLLVNPVTAGLEAVRFERGAAGDVTALLWDDDRYERRR